MAADARQVAGASLLDAALRYAARGWRVLPVRAGSKVPLTTHGVKDATTDQATIREWWAKWSTAGVAIACGAASGVVVFDVDGPEGEGSLAILECEHSKLPSTLESHTPNGRHIYLALQPGQIIRNSAGKLGSGLDVRGEDGYVVTPPSPGYTWLKWRTPLPGRFSWPHATTVVVSRYHLSPGVGVARPPGPWTRQQNRRARPMPGSSRPAPVWTYPRPSRAVASALGIASVNKPKSAPETLKARFWNANVRGSRRSEPIGQGSAAAGPGRP